EVARELSRAIKNKDAPKTELTKTKWKIFSEQERDIRAKAKEAITVSVPGANTLDKDYVFINFVMSYLPHGLIGLLMAVVFMAAMSSMASELNSLAST